MPTNTMLTQLPPRWRRRIYSTYGLLSLVGVGISAFYGAVPSLTVPDWVTGGLAVLGALAAPIGVLAASNISPDPATANQSPGTDTTPSAPEASDDTQVTGAIQRPSAAPTVTQ